MQPRAAQGGISLVPAHGPALGGVAAQDVRHALGVNGQLGAVQGAHILLRAVRRVARLVQPGKMLGPDLAVVGVVFRRECSLAAAIVKRQRCGQDSVGKIGGSPAQQIDIIQYKL